MAIEFVYSSISATKATVKITGLFSEYYNGDKLEFNFSVYDESGEYCTGALYTYEIDDDESYWFGLDGMNPETKYIVELVITKYYSSSVTSSSTYTDEIETAALAIQIVQSEPFSETDASVQVTGLYSEYSNGDSLKFTFYVYTKSGVLYDTYYYSSFDVDDDSSYWYSIDNLSSGTTYNVVLEILDEDNGKLEVPGTISTSGTTVAYEPSFDTFYVTQDSKTTTSTQVGIKVAGLDTGYIETWDLTIKVLYGNSSSTLVTKTLSFSGGVDESEPIIFTGMSQNTTYDAYGSISYTVDGVSKKYTIDPFTVTTKEADDTIYPDFDFVEILFVPDKTSIFVQLSGLNKTGYEYGDFDIVWRIYDSGDNPLQDTALARKDDFAYLGDSTSQGVTFTGLSQNTEYYIEARIYFRYAGSNNNYETKGDFFWTDVDTSSAPNLDNISINVETGECSETSLCFYVNGLDSTFTGTWKFYWEIRQTGSSTVLDTNEWTEKGGGNSSDTSLFYNLIAGTDYTVTVIVTYTTLSGKTGSRTISDTYTTDGSAVETPDEWTAYYGEQFLDLDSTVSAGYTLFAGEAIRLEFSCVHDGTLTIYSEGSSDIIGYLCSQAGFNTNNGKPTSIIIEDDDSGTGNNFLITHNVVAGQTYHLYFRCYSITASGSVTIYFVPPQAVGRPELFTWDDGSTVKTSGKEFDITASEWCALLDNINAVRVYKGYSQIQTGSTAAYFTYPDSGDEFTAIHYNQALNGITGMLGSGYNDNAVSSGDEITAAKINLLVEWLNDIE